MTPASISWSQARLALIKINTGVHSGLDSCWLALRNERLFRWRDANVFDAAKITDGDERVHLIISGRGGLLASARQPSRPTEDNKEGRHGANDEPNEWMHFHCQRSQFLSRSRAEVEKR